MPVPGARSNRALRNTLARRATVPGHGCQREVWIMQDIHRTLGALRRPPLLVRAARLGLPGYDRRAALPRLLGPGALPPVAEALKRLLVIEGAQDAARRAGAVSWRAAHHVALLIAVMGEARLLDIGAGAAAPRDTQENASGIASLRVAT